IHCHRVAIDLAGQSCCVQGRWSDGHRRNGLATLSRQSRCESCATLAITMPVSAMRVGFLLCPPILTYGRASARVDRTPPSATEMAARATSPKAPILLDQLKTGGASTTRTRNVPLRQVADEATTRGMSMLKWSEVVLEEGNLEAMARLREQDDEFC